MRKHTGGNCFLMVGNKNLGKKCRMFEAKAIAPPLRGLLVV